MRGWTDRLTQGWRSHFVPGLAAALLAGTAAADQNHYVNLLIGDRASGMGGAYTAVSDDPSGLYYNPAGIAYAPGGNLSASMNAFNYTHTEYQEALGGRNWQRTSTSLLPNFFGVIQPVAGGVLGFSYAVPDSIIEDQDQQYPGVPTSLSSNDADFTINFNNQDTTYNVGPSFAYAFSKDFSVGATLYAYQRSQELISNQVFELPGGYHWENSYLHVEEYGIKPILGVMWSPAQKIALGVSATWPQILYGQRFVQRSCATQFNISSSQCVQGTLNITKAEARYERDLPWNVDMGVALFPTKALLVAAKGSLYQDLYGGGLPKWNAALGMEYYFTPRMALRLGTYTDMANSPAVQSGSTDQTEHDNLYGASVSLSRFTRTSAITVGASGRYGQGQAQVVSGSSAIQDVSMLSVTLFMSASYSY